MLSLISAVLDQSHDPLAVSMVTEGLVALCRAEVCMPTQERCLNFELVTITLSCLCRWLML